MKFSFHLAKAMLIDRDTTLVCILFKKHTLAAAQSLLHKACKEINSAVFGSRESSLSHCSLRSFKDFLLIANFNTSMMSPEILERINVSKI